MSLAIIKPALATVPISSTTTTSTSVWKGSLGSQRRRPGWAQRNQSRASCSFSRCFWILEKRPIQFRLFVGRGGRELRLNGVDLAVQVVDRLAAAVDFFGDPALNRFAFQDHLNEGEHGPDVAAPEHGYPQRRGPLPPG